MMLAHWTALYWAISCRAPQVGVGVVTRGEREEGEVCKGRECG